MKKKVLLVFKILISFALLYFIFKKIPFTQVKETLLVAKIPWIIGAVLFFIISKLIAAARLQDYWRSIQVNLSNAYNLKLYLLGMFYNLFLPGGIGGDAYKGYLIKQHFKTPNKQLFGVLLIDRLSGLLLLVIFAAWLMAIPVHESLNGLAIYFALLVPFGVAGFYYGVKKIYPYTMEVFWKSFLKSAGVQAAQLVAAYCILEALGVNSDYGTYLLVFLLSSIVAVLPLTIGGVGSRELTFLYGASYFGLHYETAIAMSLIFFFITAVVSACGIRYHFKKPLLA